VHKYTLKNESCGIIIVMKYSIFLLLFVSILGFSTIAKAQGTSLTQSEIEINMIPESPKPGQLVQITLNSFITDINSANITWKVNGKIQKTGVGEKVFSFTVGEIGVRTTIDIGVRTKEGEVINKTIIIKPVSVDLIWQSEGFVPPFYKGKSMFSHQNKITVIAMPHITSGSGVETSSKNLIYTWKKDGSVIESASGYGKNSYTFEGSLISRPIGIEINVSSPTASDTGYAYTTITPSEPSIIFYKKDPLYGIEFQKALSGNVNLENSDEISVVGMPFFFGSITANSRELIYKWSINGSFINNDPSQTTQVFRQKEGTSGMSNISLSIENENKILQYASQSFNIMFVGKTTTQPSF